MGFIRKALYIATFGLSGLVFKEDTKPERTPRPAEKQARPKTAAKASTRAKSQATRRRKAQAARASKNVQAAPARNGTIIEIERLADLHRRGALSDEEFAAAKAKLLGTKMASAAPAPTAPARPPGTFPAVEASIAATRHLGGLPGVDGDRSITAISRD